MQRFLKRTVITPNCHTMVSSKERNVSPTLERASKHSSKGRTSYFRTASYIKQSTKIYQRKSCRTKPRTPKSPLGAKLQSILPILRRLASGRKSLTCQRDPNLEDSHAQQKREFQDYEADKTSGKSEYFRKRKNERDDKEDRRNFQKTKKLVTTNLSDMQRSNFRIRLYYQLNVVKRVHEKPSYLYSLPCERSDLMGYRPVTRLNDHFVVERSKPIAINARRISDVDFRNSEIKLREDKRSQSDKGSDSEDVFVLDIHPI